MVPHSPEPILIELDDRGTTWMIMCVPAVLSVEDWEIGNTDAITLLPEATKAQKYHVRFFWSNAEGVEVEADAATHIAAQVGSPNASDKECALERKALANRLKVARDSSIADLAY